MMKTNTVALFLFSMFLLVGCGTKSNTVIADKEYVYVTVPESLTTPVKPPRPMAKEEYLALSIYARETYLADYTVQLFGVIQTCNASLTSIRKLKDIKHENQTGP